MPSRNPTVQEMLDAGVRITGYVDRKGKTRELPGRGLPFTLAEVEGLLRRQASEAHFNGKWACDLPWLRARLVEREQVARERAREAEPKKRRGGRRVTPEPCPRCRLFGLCVDHALAAVSA